MLMSQQQHRVVQLDDVTRVALMITPPNVGTPIDQAREAISTIQDILKRQPVEMSLTKQTVFVRSADDIDAFRKLFKASYQDRVPATSFVIQPPCAGQALAIEAWALGGDGIEVRFPLPDLVTVTYDQLRWIYVAGITSPCDAACAYDEAKHSFGLLAQRLQHVGATFNDVCRIWLYQGGITEPQPGADGETIERYRELNRARADFFQQLESVGQINTSRHGHAFYPASTGIGMAGKGLTVSCLGLQTRREDVSLHPLENPRQTSAFDYARKYSPRSPLFSRAMAVKIGDHVTTWISGTASILDSETVHLGDVEKQTRQTIDNIQNLISGNNFRQHGLAGMGAELTDLAKVRVYVKHPRDYETCRAIVESRFGPVPAIYAVADVCRPDLLVEIEGVAFSDVTHSP
ncbi:Rid family hydrolase [Rhodopirellula sp. JC639]|uniref:Rid family hydrolase n=1 Tax=Stieleria mannarensis TaxID=2755585 RepID=UPI001603BBF9|nr:Rid family hydrolase [Rhodopirellula sp. JC639]